MPYAHRPIHDADSHFMETPDWFRDFADPDVRDRLPAPFLASVRPGEERRLDEFAARHRDPAYRAQDEAQLLLRKNWAATGSFLKQDRPRALDLLGFESQLVFNTFVNGKLLIAERGDDLDLAYGFARAHNRSMIDFVSIGAKSNRWQRERTVIGILSASVVQKMNFTCSGGSSSVLSRALNALSDSMWTSSMM